MNFDLKFRKKLEDNLKSNKPFLKEKSLLLLEKCLGNYYKTIVNAIYDYSMPYHLDFNSLKDAIIDVLQDKEYPVLQLRSGTTLVARGNEISFPDKSKRHLVFNSEEQIDYNRNSKKTEKECEQEFWKDENNLKDYNKLKNFDCFDDRIISEADLYKYQRTAAYLYNIDGWLDYIFELVQTTFPEFVFDKTNSSKKVFRFLKPIGNGLLFGLEYDVAELGREIKRGEISLPYYFNLILINDKTKASTAWKDYALNYHENILSLGMLGNPFFFEPCASLLVFQAIEMHYDENNPNGFIHKYKRQFVQNSDGTFQIIHPKDYGEKLKRHAFFYMQALRYSSMGYLEYVEKSIRESLY